ncbi:hypothetical protein C8R44DRAFT_177563 [Mycena epipterygia]|nr:hypothetical protein C8R44DRAFT_177563 [Mycena epipterygia]
MSTVISIPQPQPGYPAHNAGPNTAYNGSYPPTDVSNGDHSGYKPPNLVSRSISRTPSPTPSELGVKKERTLRQMIQRYLIIAIVVAVIVLIEVYHEKIITALKPVTDWLHDATAGWLIPIVVLIVLSFPPLFGHELVGMLCGLVWGLGPGFGIVAAGTLLGEICTFFVFKYWCGARGKKAELTSIPYGCLSHVVREGGLIIAVVVRYSSIPSHLMTAIFATCGMPFWIFFVAAVVGLPKQLVLVYVGVALGHSDATSNKIQRIIIGVTVGITVIAFIYIRRMMTAARPAVVYARRKARQAKMQAEVTAV